MASSLRLITSNLFITRSIVPALLVSSSSRFRSITTSTGCRSYSTTPTEDTYDPSWLNIKCPKISQLSFGMKMSDFKRELTLEAPNQGLNVELDLPGGLEKKEMKACGENNTLFIHGKPHKHFDFTGIKLPDIATSRDIKDGNDHMLAVTTPNKDEIITNIIANEVISSFRDITQERGWGYYDLFYDRAILGKGLCPLIATMSSINSFTLYKKETDELRIGMSMPGLQTTNLTTQGLCVSLEMDGLNREDVKVFFDYDTLFIEGKTKVKHYITGIHLPEGIHRKNNVIRREMEGKVFTATIPCRVKKEELLLIKDQLKPKIRIDTYSAKDVMSIYW